MAGESEDRRRYAGWWRRAAAITIDWLIITGVYVPAMMFVGVLVYESLALLVISSWVVLLSVAALYSLLTMARSGEYNGQTLGKQLLDIRVVRRDGAPVDAGYVLVRELAFKYLLFGAGGALLFGLPALADQLWPLWDRERRALHDMLAGSRVVAA